jgi:chemotaxis protein methyltransferase CheR
VAPDGWLLLSSAEDGLARGSPLAATRVGQATFHRRAPAAAEMPVACPALRAAPERAAPLAVLGHLRRCERALAVDRCDASLHCLHAGLLQALGELQSAREALRRSLFLDSEFLPAHMALVRLGRLQGDRRLARRHLALARRLLDRRRTCAS